MILLLLMSCLAFSFADYAGSYEEIWEYFPEPVPMQDDFEEEEEEVEEEEEEIVFSEPDPMPEVQERLPPPLPPRVSSSASSFFMPKRVSLYHDEGTGHHCSFGSNYWTLAFLFATEYELGQFMPLVDLRGHRFDNNKYAANIGVGARYIPAQDTFCELLGFNFYYDWRQGVKGSYNQFGVGIEVLSSRWDFRANGYIPFGSKQITSRCVFDHYSGGYYMIHKDCEFTSYGYNAEVGYLIVNSHPFLLYAAAGPYYLARACSNRTRGGEFRIRPQYKDYFAVDLSVSYDAVFHAVYQATVYVYLPLYQITSRKDRKAPCGMTDRQVYQQVERFEVMPLGRRSCWKTNF